MTDDPDMNTETTSSESTETRQPPPRPPLVRPVEGRSIGGVAAGLARYLGLSVGLMRFGFLVGVLFGGAGIVLYVAGWLLIRDESETEPIAQRVIDNLGSGSSWIGVALVVLAALIVLDNVTFLSGSLLWAIVLVIAGLLLYRGDIPGQSKSRSPAPSAPQASTATQTEAPGDEGAGPPPPAVPTPAGPPPVPPAPPRPPSILGRLTIGVALLALGTLAVIDNLTPLIDPRPRHYLALGTLVLGLGLLTGAFIGRARWMILLGIFVVPPLIASPAAEVDWRGDFERVIAPVDVANLLPAYDVPAGNYVFDLTGVQWDGQVGDLTVDMGAGEIVVIVPDGVGLTGFTRVGIGQIEAPDGDRGGIGEIVREFNQAGTDGTLNLDLELGVGSIRLRGPTEFDAARTGRFRPLENSDLIDISRSTGDIEIDLRGLDLTGDDRLEVRLGTGDVTVLTPDDLNLDILADVGSGTIDLFEVVQETSAGTSLDRMPDEGGPVLDLDIEVGTGSITVTERSR